jgi:hypothetical protein
MTAILVGADTGALDLKVRRGDKIGPLDFSWGSTVDLSDRTWAAQIRATLDEPTELTATFTVDVTAAATGTITLTLPHSESKNLVTGTTNGKPTPGTAVYYWDLQATAIADPEDVFTWVAGTIKVSGDVTVTV